MITTKPMIFLDSGNPEETRKAKELLGTLDGQTTNPSLVVKNPEIAAYMAGGKKFTTEDLLATYKRIIGEIEKELPEGHISVEVNANWNSTAEDLITQAEDMATWGKNVNIKFPTTNAGLAAARHMVSKGVRVNMTLVFDQTQAAAVYVATMGTQKPCFLSPFMGRWDDRGYNGADLIKNVVAMYDKWNAEKSINKHVMVLAASIRNMDHLMASLYHGADILTIPLKTIEAWAQAGKPVPDASYQLPVSQLKPIVYEELPLHEDFHTYNISRVDGSLLDEGLKKFSADWQSLLR